MTAAQIAAVGAELERQAEAAQAAIRDALLTGAGTAPMREKLKRIAADIDVHAAQLAKLRAEDEALREDGIRKAATEIARTSLERLRLGLAELAAPRPPKALRGSNA